MEEFKPKKIISNVESTNFAYNEKSSKLLASSDFEKKMSYLTLPMTNGGVLSGDESYIKNMLASNSLQVNITNPQPFQANAVEAIPSYITTLAQIDVQSLSIPPDIKALALGMMPNGLYFTFKVGGISDLFFTVVKFDLHEELSEMYELELQVTSFENDIDLEPMLMRTGTLEVIRNGVSERKLKGIIASVSQESISNHKSFYHFTVRPHLWRLTLEQDSRIFHNLSAPQIIQKILEEHQILFQMRLTETHEPREYTTQKRESHYDFISRLAAEEGMTFWFLNEEVVFADNCIALESRIGMVFNPDPENNVDGNILSKLFTKANMQPQKVSSKDYYWRRPSSPMKSVQVAESKDASAVAYEIYDSYPRFQDKKTADRMTRFRLESLRAESLSMEAVGHSAAIKPGSVLQITAHPSQSRNADWQVVRVSHHGVMPEESGNQINRTGTELTNKMTLIAANIPWRPTFKHKPVSEGDELAVVVGPAGEEIYTNEFGAVKIHFHWNRYDPKDENASHWVRVANSWNGNGYGFVTIPRIGQEVIVSYLNGDIDRPIIIGTTYTGADTLPINLPSQKTRSIWRTKTHKGKGFNEISFDDDNDNEFFFMKAQKNMGINVLNSKNVRVSYNRTTSIGHDDSIVVANNRTVTVDGQQDQRTGSNYFELVEGDRSIEIIGDLIQKVNSIFSLDVQGDVVIQGNSKISLKVGGSFITIHEGGVDIKSPKINLNSGGSPGDLLEAINPAVLKSAASAGTMFVAHCPLKDGK